MRDPLLKNKYDYTPVKEEAKRLWMDADAKRKNVAAEVQVLVLL